MRVVEIGAGASGFQFALANFGLDVTSVDPLINPSNQVDWVFNLKEYQKLNLAFGNHVRFIQDTIENANLPSAYYDRVFSISALEHIPQENVCSIMREVHRILKPGGLFVATIDLFLDCAPFAPQTENQYGRNISINKLALASEFDLRVGLRPQLCGFPEFDAKAILRDKEEFLAVNMVMTQCIVLEKPGVPN